MNPLILDTTIASLILNRSPSLVPYQPHLTNAALILCFQTVAEMKFGALKARWGAARLQDLDAFFGRFYIQTYTDSLVAQWATVMQEAQQAGRRLEAGDAWIAAARIFNAPLLTHDKDFSAEACPLLTVIRYL